MKADEQDLIAAVKARDESACELLVANYTPGLLALARRLLQDEEDAKDSVQDAFISAFRAIDGFRDGAPLRPWLHRILRNAAIDKLRSRGSRRETPVADTELNVSDNLRPLDPWHRRPEAADEALERQHEHHGG